MAGEDPLSGLPLSARARMAEIRESGTWSSALSTSEFAALRSAGFEPVGQVLGAAVYNIGFTGGYVCPGGWQVGRFGYGGMVASRTQVSGVGGMGSFAPLTRSMYEARRKAVSRMTEECLALGGHGVVGVRLTFGHFALGGLEFNAIGTAVRGNGTAPPPKPFTSDLSGQDFAKLISSGWVPAGLAMGISVAARHDDWATVGQTRWGAGNTEVGGYTELVNLVRHDARVQLDADVARFGAEGVVVAVNDLKVSHRECPSQEGRKDHIAEATMIGTAIARFTPSAASASAGVLPVLSLDPQRRQAARVRLGQNR
ncbi:MAG TPA: heavy metal-binding domain-containing protein [Streptosporangiaceae bacterium]|nr:heavy metal-binding domain-containing protein [Streptosporangiaceae bacterium]